LSGKPIRLAGFGNRCQAIGLILRLTGKAANGITLATNLVMPGLVPGIHVFAKFNARKTWMAGSSPAMTKNESHSIVGRAWKGWMLFRSDSEKARI
jgi:hypothetical protein